MLGQVASQRDTINLYGGAGSNQYDINLTGASDVIDNVANADHAVNPADGSDALTINGVPVNTRDGATVTGETELEIVATEEAEVVLVDVVG